MLCVTAFAFTAVAQSKKPEAPKPKAVKKGDVYVSVEKAPKFPGGLEAFGKFLSTSVSYPAVDREKNVQGKVYVQFVVERDGSISNVRSVRAPSETLKEEALRVMKISPNWTPGEQGGKAVRVEYTVPINFTLSKS